MYVEGRRLPLFVQEEVRDPELPTAGGEMSSSSFSTVER